MSPLNNENRPQPVRLTIDTAPAISVRNACKTYANGVPVLQNFNMTIPLGTCYGLLGASGCGKTTMLSCLVGIRSLDSGDILVYNKRPGTEGSGIPGPKIGYMPQDIALYNQLTIKETFEYFGRVYGMSQLEIIGRMEFVTNFLSLPPASRTVATLSGGQQRRLSLSTCFFHEPTLLILDEPTVGVDPLLREKIWNYLFELVTRKKTTILITTHYIEEARQSHTVGLMRNGRLLVEKSPEVLLEEHGMPLLEDIVLKLCKNDISRFEHNNEGETTYEIPNKETNKTELVKRKSESPFNNNKSREVDKNPVVGLKFKQIEENNQQTNNYRSNFNTLSRRPSFIESSRQNCINKFSRIKALAIRNTLILLRTPIFLLAIFFLPSFEIIIVNNTLGPEPKNMNFGVISPELKNNLSVCEEIHPGCVVDNLSCRYLKTLPTSSINPVLMNSTDDALAMVKEGKLWGYMSFPRNFSQQLVNFAVFSKIFSDNYTLDERTISYKMDMSDYFAGRLLTKTFFESFQIFAKKTLNNCGQNHSHIDTTMNFRPPIYGTFDIEMEEYITPGVLLIIVFFIPYLSCSVANITDRKQGTLDRSMVAGVKLTDVLVAFFLTEGMLIVIQTLISYAIVIFLFKMDIRGNHFAFMMLNVLTGLSGLSLGFLAAQVCDEELEALIIGIGGFIPNLILGGIIWPLEAAPLVMRQIAYCMPVTWAISSMRSIVSRGWSVTHPHVWPGFATLLAWITATWILIIFLAYRSKRI